MENQKPEPENSDEPRKYVVRKRKIETDQEQSSIESGQTDSTISLYDSSSSNSWNSTNSSVGSMQNLERNIEEDDSSIKIRRQLLLSLRDIPSISQISFDSIQISEESNDEEMHEKKEESTNEDKVSENIDVNVDPLKTIENDKEEIVEENKNNDDEKDNPHESRILDNTTDASVKDLVPTEENNTTENPKEN